MAVLKHAGIASVAPDLDGTQEILDSVGRNSGVLKWLTRRDVTQGDSVKVEAITTTNSSASTFTEDDAIAAAAPTITEGSLDMEEFVVAWGISGSALRRAGVHGDLILEENRNDALKALLSYIEAWTCSSKSTEKMIGQIDDDTTNWLGVDRSSVTALKSHVVAGGSATMTLGGLYNGADGVQDAPFIGAPEIMLSSVTQLRVYKTSIMAEPVPGQGGGRANTGYKTGPAEFGELPWFPVRGMLNTVVLFLTGVRGGAGRPYHMWYNFQPETYLEKYGVPSATIPFRVGLDGYEIGRLAVCSLGATNDSASQFAITGGAYGCRAPAAQAMIEALATS